MTDAPLIHLGDARVTRDDGRVVFDGAPSELGDSPAALDQRFHELTGAVEVA